MKKIIIINGPSCAGKSTIIDEFFLYKKKFFWLKYDAIKRFFVDYNPISDKEKVQELVILVGKNRIDKDENILFENRIDEVVDYAECKGYSIFEFNIEAPYEILLQRFRERMLNIKTGIKVNTSESRHREIYNAYTLHKKNNTITFDTSILTKEEIVLQIIKSVYMIDENR